MLPCPAVELYQTRIIVFDNDGTLYPAGPAVGGRVLEAHAEYVKRHGLDLATPSKDWLNEMIGLDAREFYAGMMPNQPAEVRQDFEDFCLKYELEAVREHPYMYAGAEELLAALKRAGRQLALVSNGGPSYVKNVWDVCGYGRFFAASYPNSPPDYASKGERLKQAIGELGGGPAVMIGDRRSDLEAAREAGAAFIGCGYGYGLPGELDGARLIDDIAELYNLLLAPEERA